MIPPFDISITDFTYHLPPERIAAFPEGKRDRSKLLISRGGRIEEGRFDDLPAFLPSDSLLVFNNTRVISARLLFTNHEGQRIELFCLEPANKELPERALLAKAGVCWRCLVGNQKRWKEKQLHLNLNGVELVATAISKNTGSTDISFSWHPPELSFAEVVQRTGNIPIPPYLNRESVELDKQRYQTVYADKPGSVAAPTAGLHFTNDLLLNLAQSGVKQLQLTLHVGAGTFKPVKSQRLEGHAMHAEWMDVERNTIEELRNNVGKNIIAVGTTSLRAMESLYWMGFKVLENPGISPDHLELSQWEPYTLNKSQCSPGDCLDALLEWMTRNGYPRLMCLTSILIAPPYEFKLARGIITNFHQPQSTLLLIIAAFAGKEWKTIYDYALEHDFRFLSYGDSSLLLK